MMANFSRGDYVFTDHYLLFKIKMDASVHLQFNQSTNQWLAKSWRQGQLLSVDICRVIGARGCWIFG